MVFKIKEAREKANIPQEKLAYEAGISRATLMAIENNTAESCNTKTLEGIARVLGVPVSSLFLD